MKLSAFLVLLLALPAAAIETRWTATGTVSTVTGTGLTATAGAPVTVKFSYDSAATVDPKLSFSSFSNIYYYGAINLAMEVSIGESKWTASLPVAPASEVIYAEARNAATDLFTVKATTDNTATFPLFPYSGSATSRSISVNLQDNHNPSLLLTPQVFPDQDSCNPSTLSAATGEIKAGTDSIKFNINLTSVTVETGTSFKVTIEQTATGIRLRWPTEEDVIYLLFESDDCVDWGDEPAIHVGDGQECVVELPNIIAEHPHRRFFKVETE